MSCLICEDVIDDDSQQSIMCEGTCSAWLHRGCAGLSRAALASLRDSPDPFRCPNCRLNEQASELASLKAQLSSLSCEFEKLRSSAGTSNGSGFPTGTSDGSGLEDRSTHH